MSTHQLALMKRHSAHRHTEVTHLHATHLHPLVQHWSTCLQQHTPHIPALVVPVSRLQELPKAMTKASTLLVPLAREA